MVRSSRVPGRLMRCSVLLFGAAVLVAGAVAMAAGDERTTTESLLEEVDRSPRKEVAEPFTARSRAALERASRLRASGDQVHAKLADGVARSWAEAARDIARAAVVEQSAAASRRSATDAGVLADRERALLEEAIAQSGRLRAQLEAAPREGKEQPARTSTAAASGDAGVRTPTKPAPAKDAGAPQAPKTTADGGAR